MWVIIRDVFERRNAYNIIKTLEGYDIVDIRVFQPNLQDHIYGEDRRNIK